MWCWDYVLSWRVMYVVKFAQSCTGLMKLVSRASRLPKIKQAHMLEPPLSCSKRSISKSRKVEITYLRRVTWILWIRWRFRISLTSTRIHSAVYTSLQALRLNYRHKLPRHRGTWILYTLYLFILQWSLIKVIIYNWYICKIRFEKIVLGATAPPRSRRLRPCLSIVDITDVRKKLITHNIY